ncbi:hypothetical protein FACS189492_1080 [Clostridia bacterium]|nr:hypothetical protein FACS189492_1080 [Clostridia bacterium]
MIDNAAILLYNTYTAILGYIVLGGKEDGSNISTEKAPAEKGARFQGADVHKERAEGVGAAQTERARAHFGVVGTHRFAESEYAVPPPVLPWQGSA